MTNISALLALLPESSAAPSTPGRGAGSSFFKGPIPYAAYERVGVHKTGFSRALVAAIDAVRASTRFGPVYEGDLSVYDDDHSRADLGLAGEFARQGLNKEAIDTAIRTSGLYRLKWERDDYRNNTISKALHSVSDALGGQLDGYSSQTTTEEPRPSAGEHHDGDWGQTATEEPPPSDGEQGDGPWITDPRKTPPSMGGAESPSGKLLDPAHGKITISTEPPLPRDFTLGGLLLPGKSAVLAGFGGVSKTQLALQLATAIVLGRAFMTKAVKQGKVLVILGEEDQGEVSRRLSAIARREKLSEGQIQRLEADMRAYPLVGRDIRLTMPSKDGLIERSFAKDIIKAAKAMGDVGLIVVDHLALIHGGEHNAREDAAITMRVLNDIAQQTGAAVLLLAHTPKGASDKDESDASMVAGSTAFVDQARGVWVLATMRKNEATNLGVEAAARKGYVSLTIVKNNYGPTGEIIWFKRVAFDDVGLLEDVVLHPRASGEKAAVDLQAKIVAFVAANRGQFSKTGLRDTQAGKQKEPFKASKGDVQGAIENLLSDARLVNRAPSLEERQKFGLGPRVTHVLDLGAP